MLYSLFYFFRFGPEANFLLMFIWCGIPFILLALRRFDRIDFLLHQVFYWWVWLNIHPYCFFANPWWYSSKDFYYTTWEASEYNHGNWGVPWW